MAEHTRIPKPPILGPAPYYIKLIEPYALRSALGKGAPWLKDTNSSAGYTPSNPNNLYHDEGQARYTAAEPPTATVVESLDVPIHSLPAEGAGSLGAWTALPAPPPPIATTFIPFRYGSSPPPLNPFDKYCEFSKKAGPCDFRVDGKLKFAFYKHILYTDIAGELSKLVKGTLRIQDAEILTTQDRVWRARSYAWRCPSQDCRYWSMNKHSVIRHTDIRHEEVDPQSILQTSPDGISSTKAVIRAILGDEEHGDIEWEDIVSIFEA
ncbi:hypothetical protein JB92DRAFT_3131269 [Gautieria morchelliformis]|nr:hypothetical protein JB92DRAFT_3131269 [Gautieria morchelliformis]